MSVCSLFIRYSYPGRCVVRKLPAFATFTLKLIRRTYADTSRRDPSKQDMVHGTEHEARVRVRRARSADAPEVIRFVRDNAHLAWPATVSAPNHTVLSDYVARILAQGHTLLAEQHLEKRGWSQIRGLALSTSASPWDASLLEKWARCLQCPRSQKLILLTAHCLRAPDLHEKYQIHNVLQIVLMVPPDISKHAEVVQMLVRNSIQRGRELGFPLLRFDVKDDPVEQALQGLPLKKEYEINYDLLFNVIKINTADKNNKGDDNSYNNRKILTVYTSFPTATADI